ncbi:CG18607 [Drosophila busckii]|uniref:aralkylamine N-acetyltransferase n=1 Tax=Drosophila busckii TaxID=30019 RepID=A0A0M5IYP3_DROBS|nr:CG18607 [Drosophila busckii]
MNVEEYEQVKILLEESFFKDEPLGSSSGEDIQKCNEELNDNFHRSMIEQEPSIVDSFAAEAFKAKDNIWGKIVTVQIKALREGNVYERYGVSKVLLSNMTTVVPSMRGKGLGTRLAAALMEIGRNKGFEVMIAFCTSFYSARQKRAMGMECIYSLAYAEYKDEKASSDEEFQKINGEEQFVIEEIKQGLSIVAVDATNSEQRIVGCTIAGAQHDGYLLELLKESSDDAEHSSWRNMLALFNKASTEANLHERYGVNQLLITDMTAVDASMRGRGIGARLTSALIELGRAKGFEVMVGFCTSFYSLRQKKALGMECIYEVAFADFLDANGDVVFKPPAPHTHFHLLAMRL